MKVKRCFRFHQNNIKNFRCLISVDNANRLLIDNFENLEFLLEEAFQNPQAIADRIREMNPRATPKHDKCPSDSDSDESDEMYSEDEPKVVEEKKPSSVECFFVEPSSAPNTRVDSIVKLETTLENLNEEIGSIEDQMLSLKQQISMKKKKLQNAILKVIEFEEQIEDLEKLMETNLHNFQLRIISLEKKLQSNFQGKFYDFFASFSKLKNRF